MKIKRMCQNEGECGTTLKAKSFGNLGRRAVETHLDEVTPIVDGDQTIMSVHDWHLVVPFLPLGNLTFAISIEWLTQSLHTCGAMRLWMITKSAVFSRHLHGVLDMHAAENVVV